MILSISAPPKSNFLHWNVCCNITEKLTTSFNAAYQNNFDCALSLLAHLLALLLYLWVAYLNTHQKYNTIQLKSSVWLPDDRKSNIHPPFCSALFFTQSWGKYVTLQELNVVWSVVWLLNRQCTVGFWGNFFFFYWKHLFLEKRLMKEMRPKH